LGEEDAQSAEVEEFRQKIEAAKLPVEAEKQAQLNWIGWKDCRPLPRNMA
jgi:ATP-dependent Lon protease